MKEVLRALRPVKARIRRNRFLTGAAAGLAAGLAAAVILQAAALFVPVPDRGLWAGAVTVAATVITALVNALRPVKNVTAAEKADACGLKERAITALEAGDSPIRRLQRRDACEALSALDVKKIRPGSVKKPLTAAAGCAALLAALLLVASPQDPAAAARKALDRTLREGRETISRAAEEDAERLADEKKSELRKITADLNRELDRSRDAADALVALDRAEQRLEQLRQQAAGEASASADGTAGENASGQDESAGRADSLSAADISAEGAAGQQGIKASGASAAQLQTLQALAALKQAVNPSAQAGKNTQAAYGQGGNGQGMNGQGTSGSGSSGAGRQAGNGAGEGSTNEEQQGSDGGNGPVNGSREPHYKEGEYETIYDPEHIGKSRQDMQTEQNRVSDEDSLQIETGPGRGNLSGDVPWGEALREYAETEARSADRENLTMQERQWVDEYYRLLTEQQ